MNTLRTGAEAVRRWAVGVDTQVKILGVSLVVVFVCLALLRPQQFLAAANFHSMSLQVAEIGLLTFAMSLTMLVGGIDLSITANANLSAIAAGSVMLAMTGGGASGTSAALVGVVVCLSVGCLAGLVNGLLIGYAGVVPILATMATLMLYSGIGTVLTGGVSIFGFPAELLQFARVGVLGIPFPPLAVVVVVAALWYLLNRTTFGLRMRLQGANPRAALYAGVQTRRIILQTHTLAGVLSSVAGLFTLVKTDSANSSYGTSYILLSILIAVLGGVSIAGGRGTVAGIALAIVTVQLLSTGFNMVLAGSTGANFFKDVAWGVLLLAVLTLTTLVRRRVPRSLRGGPAGAPRAREA